MIAELHKSLASSLTRQINSRTKVYKKLSTGEWELSKIYTVDDGIVEWSFSGGKTSGGFSIGNTICFVFECQFLKKAIIPNNAKIELEIQFINPLNVEEKTEWIALGTVFVDNISVDNKGKFIIAMDKMLQLEKNYRTETIFPITVDTMLNDIAVSSNFDLVDEELLNNIAILTYPFKGVSGLGFKLRYTKRELLGFIASLQGTNCYFNKENKLKLLNYEINPVPIIAENCYSYSTDGEEYKIDDVVWESEDTLSSADIENNYKTVFFQNPLNLSLTEKSRALSKIKGLLIGQNVKSIIIDKQGTGFYNIGDIIEVVEETGESFKAIISALKYTMSKNGFRERITCLASSESESNYDAGLYTNISEQENNTNILYSFNLNAQNLSEDYQTILELDFSSVYGATVVSYTTLNPVVNSSGYIDVAVYIDSDLTETFQKYCVAGSDILTVVYPLLTLQNGSHKIEIKVKGSADALFSAESCYLSLIGNGVVAGDPFVGTLKISDKARLIELTNGTITVKGFNEKSINEVGIAPTQSDLNVVVPSVKLIEEQLLINNIVDFVDNVIE